MRGRCAVVIVAVTQSDELVLIEQYRPAVDARCLELPAGLVGDQEDPDEALELAAARELEEETGFRPARVERLTTGPASAGLSDESLTLVRATGLTRVGPGGGDAHEDITVHLVPRAELRSFVAARESAGVVIDLKLWAGLYFASP